MSRYGWFRPERHEVDVRPAYRGLVPDRCGHLFLDELDRLADRLGNHGAVAPRTRSNGDADVLHPQSAGEGRRVGVRAGIRTPWVAPPGPKLPAVCWRVFSWALPALQAGQTPPRCPVLYPLIPGYCGPSREQSREPRVRSRQSRTPSAWLTLLWPLAATGRWPCRRNTIACGLTFHPVRCEGLIPCA